MKKTLFVLGTLVLLTSSFTFLAKEQSGGSDVCETYFPIKKGTQLTYENLDAKNKLVGTDFMTLTDLIEADGMTTMKIHASSKDEKGELVYESDFEAFCKNGVFTVSMESMMSAETMQAYKDMDVKVTQTEVMYPNNMAVGMTLPDASMNLKISMDGMQIMSMDFKITDRKIEAVESITTAAGTFECFKLTESTNMKAMMMDRTYKTTNWLSKKVGNVRTETYYKDKLESTRILTNIKE
jgi:hypothetical protein